MPRMYVVRHAEPAVTGVFLGQSDPPLSDAGRSAAQGVMGSLPGLALFTSPLRRARETAAASPFLEAVTLDDLREIGLGEWDGLSWAEIENRDPAMAQAKLRDWLGVTPPGGERWRDFEARVNRAIDGVIAGPSPAIVVAHLTVDAVIAHRMTGADPTAFVQNYCEILTYDFPPVD